MTDTMTDELVTALQKVKHRCFQADEANWQHDILSIVVPLIDGASTPTVADDGKLVERFSRWLDYVTSNSNRRVGEPSTDDYRRLIKLAAERIATRLEQDK